MSVQETDSVAQMKLAPEIATALASIELAEVQDMIRRLAKFNLAVYMPHMHLPEIDFAAQPNDVVQVEEDCRVGWVPRSELPEQTGSVPVAWRWVDDGVHASAKCIAICSPNPKKGHKKTGHLPG